MTVARVKGSGILEADLVFNTVAKDARGDANMATQNKTAKLPIIAAASGTGKDAIIMAEAAKTPKQAVMCCVMEPGKEGDLGGAN